MFIGGIRVCTDNLNPALKSVQQVDIINPGAGYTTPPSVQFIGGGGAGAAATAVINTGVVGLATIQTLVLDILSIQLLLSLVSQLCLLLQQQL